MKQKRRRKPVMMSQIDKPELLLWLKAKEEPQRGKEE